MSQGKNESVFSRWSRRKLEAKEAGENPALVEEIEVAADSQLPEAAETQEPEAPVLTDADMPDIETLTEESDFSPFMSPGVSEELRRLALRKLFRSSVFNVRDGLDEYDDDFTTFEKLGDIVTSDMKHRIEMEKEKLREKLEAEEALDEDDSEMIEDDLAETDQPVGQSQEEVQVDNAGLHEDPEEDIDEQY